MATETDTLNQEPTTLYYNLELKDAGIIQTNPGTACATRDENQGLAAVVSDFTLDKCGFEMVKHESKEKDFLDEDHVKETYYPEVIDIVKKV